MDKAFWQRLALWLAWALLLVALISYQLADAKSSPVDCQAVSLPPAVTCFDIPLGHCYVTTSNILRHKLRTISCVRYP
jgi:hypothetical protein